MCVGGWVGVVFLFSIELERVPGEASAASNHKYTRKDRTPRLFLISMLNVSFSTALAYREMPKEDTAHNAHIARLELSCVQITPRVSTVEASKKRRDA